jgi:hypothetical protein
MKLKQISVTLEKRLSQISLACRALADADINITSLSLADAGPFGIIRLLIQDHDRALAVLIANGFSATLTEVVAVDVPGRPGGLADVLETIEEVGIQIEYIYAFTYRAAERAIIIFRFADPDGAIQALHNGGFHVLDSAELSRRVEEPVQD